MTNKKYKVSLTVTVEASCREEAEAGFYNTVSCGDYDSDGLIVSEIKEGNE